MFKHLYAALIIFVISRIVTKAQVPNCQPVLTYFGRFDNVCQPNCAPREPANECYIARFATSVQICPPPLCCRDVNNQCISTVRIGK